MYCFITNAMYCECANERVLKMVYILLGRTSNRRSRGYPVDSVSAGSAQDQQDDTCPGRWRAVSSVTLCCRNLPPQPGQYDTEAETTRPHSPRSRVFVYLFPCTYYDFIINIVVFYSVFIFYFAAF